MLPQGRAPSEGSRPCVAAPETMVAGAIKPLRGKLSPFEAAQTPAGREQNGSRLQLTSWGFFKASLILTLLKIHSHHQSVRHPRGCSGFPDTHDNHFVFIPSEDEHMAEGRSRLQGEPWTCRDGTGKGLSPCSLRHVDLVPYLLSASSTSPPCPIHTPPHWQ